MDDLYHIADSLGNLLREHKLFVCTAESCTGGGLAYALTSVPRSSHWFRCGWVTYSNETKQSLIDVPASLLEEYGAVSEPIARAMAEGALNRSKCEVSIAITGIAGPSGGSPQKPVGTVWVAWAVKIDSVHHVETQLLSLSGNREEIRQQSIKQAISGCERFVRSLYF